MQADGEWNNNDDSELDTEKLQEAYRKVDLMFGIASRERPGCDKTSVTEYAHGTNRTPFPWIQYDFLSSVALFSIIIIFVLFVVFVDEIYLLFNRY